MKKTLRALLALLILALLATSLLSCGLIPSASTDNPYSIIAKADEAMDNLASYTVRGTMTVFFELNGEEYTTLSEITSTVFSANTGDFAEQTQANYKLYKGESVESEYKIISGFSDGWTYTSNELYGFSIKSPVDKAAYLEQKSSSAAQDSVFLPDATKENFSSANKTADESGKMTLVFSGVTESALEGAQEFVDTLGLPDATLEDMVITAVINSDYRYEKLEIQFIFKASENGGAKPNIAVTMRYTNVGTTTEPRIDLTSYKVVSNLLEIERAEQALKAVKNKENGAFSLRLHQYTMIGGSYNGTTLTSTGLYGVRDGGYFYDITSSATDNSMSSVKYSGGTQTVNTKDTQGNETKQTNSITDREAKAIINELLDVGAFTAEKIKDVRTEDGGSTVIFTVAESENTVKALLPKMTSINSYSVEIACTYEGEELVGYVYTLNVDFDIRINGIVYKAVLNIEADCAYMY